MMEPPRAWLEVHWALPRKGVTVASEDVAEQGVWIESLLAETAVANSGSPRVAVPVKCGFIKLRTREEDGEQLIQYTHRPPL